MSIRKLEHPLLFITIDHEKIERYVEVCGLKVSFKKKKSMGDVACNEVCEKFKIAREDLIATKIIVDSQDMIIMKISCVDEGQIVLKIPKLEFLRNFGNESSTDWFLKKRGCGPFSECDRKLKEYVKKEAARVRRVKLNNIIEKLRTGLETMRLALDRFEADFKAIQNRISQEDDESDNVSELGDEEGIWVP